MKEFVFWLLAGLAKVVAARKTAPDVIAILFAHAIVPGLALWATLATAGSSPLLTASGAVSIIRFGTTLEANGTHAVHPAIGIIVQPEPVDVSVVMARAPSRALTSLTPQELESNAGHIALRGQTVTIQAPLNGVARPLAILVDGSCTRELGVPGGSAQIEDVLLAARHAPNILVALLVGATFAVGLGIASPDAIRVLTAAE
jgi:hypothetical protein